ncbi:MAG: B12-binding domain-containing radical SAM protein [Anaerolineae bacterium]
MKIRLIEPKPVGAHVFGTSALPRLGLPLIATVLAEKGHDVKVYVEGLAPVDWDDVTSADLVGLSATTATAPAAYAIADGLKYLSIPTVMGGSHVTFMADEALEHCNYVIRGEGHYAIVELLEALDGKRNLDDVAGLSYRKRDGCAVHNPERGFCSLQEFQSLPWPDLSLVTGHEVMFTKPLMTQWGCPYNCDFCGVIKLFGRQVRYRRVDDTVQHLRQHYRGENLFMYDDNFVANRQRSVELLRRLVDEDIEIHYGAQVRADAIYANKSTREIDRELLTLMRDSGCYTVYIGYESVNPEALKAYNKQQDVQTIVDSIKAFHQHDIKVHGMFILGSDADTVESIRATVDFAIEHGIDTVQFLVLTPVPGTAFFERMESAGRIITKDWTLYDGHHVVTRTMNMSPYELQLEAVRAMSRFYSAREVASAFTGDILRTVPFYAGLLVRDLRLSVHLPKIAVEALIPEKRMGVLNELQRLIGYKDWSKILRQFAPLSLYRSNRQMLEQWAKQPWSALHLERLRLIPPMAKPALRGL